MSYTPKSYIKRADWAAKQADDNEIARRSAIAKRYDELMRENAESVPANRRWELSVLNWGCRSVEELESKFQSALRRIQAQVAG